MVVTVAEIARWDHTILASSAANQTNNVLVSHGCDNFYNVSNVTIKDGVLIIV